MISTRAINDVTQSLHNDVAVPVAQPVDLPPPVIHPADSGTPLRMPVNPIHKVQTRLRVCIGNLDISVGELMTAKAGQVFQLDRAVDQPVDLLLEGEVVARGELVAVDDQFGIRITELPVDLRSPL